MSDTVLQDLGMTKNRRSKNRFAIPVITVPRIRRMPRGLLMLRALRLRLAAENQPRLCQMEFRFGK
jgi:hypothetical protein